MTSLYDSCHNGHAGRQDASSCAFVVRSSKLADVLQRNSCGDNVYYASRNKPYDIVCSSYCVRGSLVSKGARGE
jgi:hypothetical protein